LNIPVENIKIIRINIFDRYFFQKKKTILTVIFINIFGRYFSNIF